MNIRLTKDAALTFTGYSAFLLFLGIGLSYPMQFDWSSVINALAPIAQAWWKPAAVFALLGVVSFLLKRRHIVTAEYVGTFACCILFYPLLSLLTGLPGDLGLKSVLFGIAGMFLLPSLSALLSVTILNLQIKSGEPT